jgi:hypothetical protein
MKRAPAAFEGLFNGAKAMPSDSLERIVELLRPKFHGPGYAVARELKARVKSLKIRYLHLTPVRNAESIRLEGLKSEQGRIFFLDDPLVVADVAINQVSVEHIQVFGLKPPKGWRLRPDVVGESTASRQWYYKGTHIPPEYLVDLGMFRAVPPFDQFIPVDKKMLKMLPKQMRQEYERGLWPPGVMAYLEHA